LSTIPAGWQVDEATPDHLTLRRNDAAPGGTWLDKILIAGGYDDDPGDRRAVTVNDAQGWIDYGTDHAVSRLLST
jgi:hypothetical protein